MQNTPSHGKRLPLVLTPAARNVLMGNLTAEAVWGAVRQGFLRVVPGRQCVAWNEYSLEARNEEVCDMTSEVRVVCTRESATAQLRADTVGILWNSYPLPGA